MYSIAGMEWDSIHGFTYEGGNHHRDCIAEKAEDICEENCYYPEPLTAQDTHDAINLRVWAERNDIDPDDLRSFDSGDFPKPYEGDHSDPEFWDEVCATCEEPMNEQLRDHVSGGNHDAAYYLAYAKFNGKDLDFETDRADDAFAASDVDDLYRWYKDDYMPDFESRFHVNVAKDRWSEKYKSVDYSELFHDLMEAGFSVTVDEDTVDQSFVLEDGFVIRTH